jgi:hypothetical protein
MDVFEDAHEWPPLRSVRQQGRNAVERAKASRVSIARPSEKRVRSLSAISLAQLGDELDKVRHLRTERVSQTRRVVRFEAGAHDLDPRPQNGLAPTFPTLAPTHFGAVRPAVSREFGYQARLADAGFSINQSKLT